MRRAAFSVLTALLLAPLAGCLDLAPRDDTAWEIQPKDLGCGPGAPAPVIGADEADGADAAEPSDPGVHARPGVPPLTMRFDAGLRDDGWALVLHDIADIRFHEVRVTAASDDLQPAPGTLWSHRLGPVTVGCPVRVAFAVAGDPADQLGARLDLHLETVGSGLDIRRDWSVELRDVGAAPHAYVRLPAPHRGPPVAFLALDA